MDFTRTNPDTLEDLVRLLPSKSVPVAYGLKLRDGSVYVATSQHLSYRLYLIAKGASGDASAKVSSVIRQRGVSHVTGFKVFKTEAAADAFAEKWREQLRKQGVRIATDTLTEENKAAAAAHLWSEDVAQVTGDPLADGDF